MPHSMPMPRVGMRCNELRVIDEHDTWRLIYRLDSDAIVVLEVFAKKTSATPSPVIAACRKRLQEYDSAKG